MLHAPVLANSIAGRADVMPPRFDCSWTGGGPHAVGAHAELDVATRRQLDRTLREAQSEAVPVVLDLREVAFMDSVLTLAGRRDDVEIHRLEPVDPTVQVLVQLADAAGCS